MKRDGAPLPSRRFELIVWDWDGTLADSTAIIAASLQNACAAMGIAIPSAGAARHVIGLGLADALQHVAPGLPAERHCELTQHYRNHYLHHDADIPLFAGAAELLAELQSAGHLLAVATGKSRRGLDRAMDQYGLRGMFAASRCADEGYPKPHPDMLLYLMDRLNVRPAQTLMIGDTTHDIHMAHSSGVTVVGVSYGAHPVEELQAADPVAVVDSIGELRSWLTSR
ncbi:MAG: HAD-IA family hydrolase [Betaproteobacteria bacterium]